MITPLNAISKASISPVPKPPKAVNFTGLGNFSDAMHKTSKSAFNFVEQKGIPFVEKQAEKIVNFIKDLKIGEKINKVMPKIEENFDKAIKWVKDLKISEKISKHFDELKDAPFFKEFGADLKKLFSKIKM